MLFFVSIVRRFVFLQVYKSQAVWRGMRQHSTYHTYIRVFCRFYLLFFLVQSKTFCCLVREPFLGTVHPLCSNHELMSQKEAITIQNRIKIPIQEEEEEGEGG